MLALSEQGQKITDRSAQVQMRCSRINSWQRAPEQGQMTTQKRVRNHNQAKTMLLLVSKSCLPVFTICGMTKVRFRPLCGVSSYSHHQSSRLLNILGEKDPTLVLENGEL